MFSSYIVFLIAVTNYLKKKKKTSSKDSSVSAHSLRKAGQYKNNVTSHIASAVTEVNDSI